MSEYILTATTGRNSDVFPKILKLYAKPGDVIADVTYGKGVFWKDIDASIYRFYPSDIVTGTDMRELPYPNNTFDMVVLDPPYMHTPGTVKKSISSQYGINELCDVRRTKDVIELYRGGMSEVHRTLKRKGFLVVKCQDGIESGKQHWNHISIYDIAIDEFNMRGKDLFILVQSTHPAMRWKHQIHARKNHSYFWVFQKR